MKTIVITIRADGSVKSEANGFTGDECRETTKQLLDAVGSFESEQLKAEFYQSQQEQQQSSQKA